MPSHRRRPSGRVYSCSDSDDDGVPSFRDHCNAFADPGQEDANLDGVADACDFTWGDATADGVVNVSDAVWALRASVGLTVPTPDELRRGDVAPFDEVGGTLTPWCEDVSAVQIADAVAILRASVGLSRFALPR